ncbi:DEAD-box ATP-dependent RNA helicase 50 [Prunus yedoensis var. nudiflora]|uniref:DEAD-box ATP-dependent RNA helicase 50 n=1 Tax=Prunus yedoensis var. nudiflora TaxID=2094558 RepID=A0A314UBC7_PRUYE|nr:DEAD-box ATP-dependent RNA helicase 50 [Prunus yedoensis var. nudiflora]
MIECLRRQLFQRPSHIQYMLRLVVLPVVATLDSEISMWLQSHCDPLGLPCQTSGIFVATVGLLINNSAFREEELQGLSKPLSQSPRVVILVPTAELASQVLGICRSMSKFGVPVRSMVVTGGHRQKTQLENLQQDVDILIATPGRFMYLIKEGFLQLSNLRCAVLDEVDILFNDEDFEAALEMVMAPGMHRVSPGLEEVLVDCSGDDGSERSPEMAFSNKKSALLQLVEGSPVAKSIIFCNKIETCRKVENVLTRFDRSGTRVQVLPFHSALAQESRLANMKQFTNSHSKEVSQFLVCTDRASRGIDFSGVIM